MRILFIGDVVGSPGRDMVKEYVPKLKAKHKPHFTIINGENAAHGKGLTEKIYHSLMEAGADAITMGNHTWDKREIFDFIDDVPHLVRRRISRKVRRAKALLILNRTEKSLPSLIYRGGRFFRRLMIRLLKRMN